MVLLTIDGKIHNHTSAQALKSAIKIVVTLRGGVVEEEAVNEWEPFAPIRPAKRFKSAVVQRTTVKQGRYICLI